MPRIYAVGYECVVHPLRHSIGGVGDAGVIRIAIGASSRRLSLPDMARAVIRCRRDAAILMKREDVGLRIGDSIRFDRRYETWKVRTKSRFGRYELYGWRHGMQHGTKNIRECRCLRRRPYITTIAATVRLILR